MIEKRFASLRFDRMSRFVFASLCVGLLFACSGCVKSDVSTAEAEERGSSLYRKARAAEQSGDIKEAIRLYNRVLIDEPKSFSAHFQLATLLQDQEENYVAAIYHYQQYLYLRPESEKTTLAQERIRICEQLLAPQILRKVGDSVQGISQAHLLKENDRLNRVITTMEGEKSKLLEAASKAEKEASTLRGDNERLREILSKMRVTETVAEPSESILKRVEAVVKSKGEETASTKRLDAKTLRALREEAASAAGGEAERKPVVDVPSTEAVLKKVKTRLAGEAAEPSAAKAEPQAAPAAERAEKSEKAPLSSLSLFGKDKEEKREKTGKGGEQRTYVVQPGDSLFRVSEKFYGDSTHWKKIRDANRTRIDPDGRIRAGQIIVVP
jgi:LysM repeat protein